MKNSLPKYRFVQKAVKRFMPGEDVESALVEAKKYSANNISTVLTCLGENISELKEGENVRNHYLAVLEKISLQKLQAEISAKLTQLGFDINEEATLQNVRALCLKAKEKNNFVWLDIESSPYVTRTINFYKTIRGEFENVGLCLQAYLYRTKDDLKSLLEISPSIRLVKGAYKESPDVAFPNKNDVDKNFIALSEMLLKAIPDNIHRIGFGTHDETMHEQIKMFAKKNNIPNDMFEFQMLYGIKNNVQLKLVSEGYKVRALISYGLYWFPWYMRRLAERPANVWFVLKSIFS
jgi:proline dehydrogenase